MRRVVFALIFATGAAVQAAPTVVLDFSTEADETGDPFAASVQARYAEPISMAAALADLRAAGMTCTQGASPSCSKSVEANGCTYTFAATVRGTAERAIVRGETRNDC